MYIHTNINTLVMAEAATQLAKQIFNNKEVRIFGTSDAPLFIAADIGALLGIKNVHQVISGFDEYEKGDICISDTTGRLQTMTVLTEPGLYSVILKSRKPIAKEFKRWLLTEVLPSLRKEGKYEVPPSTNNNSAEEIISPPKTQAIQPLPPPIERAGSLPFQILDAPTTASDLPTSTFESKTTSANSQIEKYKNTFSIESKNLSYPSSQTHWDLNEFHDRPCIYLLHITAADYKFGQTTEIIDREMAHRTYFRKYGHEISVVGLWNCATTRIMKDVELRIKILSKSRGWFAPKYDKHEIITCPDITNITDKIDKYITDLSITDEGTRQILMREYDLAEKKMESDIRLAELDVRRREIELEYYKLRCNLSSATISSVPVLPSGPVKKSSISHENDYDFSIECDRSQSIFTPMTQNESLCDLLNTISITDAASSAPTIANITSAPTPSNPVTRVTPSADTSGRVFTCARCKKEKPSCDYRTSNKTTSGYETKCKVCRGKKI